MPMSSSIHHLLGAVPEPLRPEAARRYAAHGPALHSCLHRLYGEAHGFEQWYGSLLSAVGELHGARGVELAALDTARAAQPDWFLGQQMLGYCGYVDRLGGDLRGVAARIPHLQELGVRYLHLLPFLKMREGENDGGFAVASFEEVDPRFGSNADLEALTGKLRSAGISLCADFILNHVADDHDWARGAREGDERLRKFFHVFPGRSQADSYERTLGQVFPQAAPGNFTHVPALDGWAWTTFYPYQWDLNWSNPEVFAAMAATLLRLANRGVEVFRLDSTAFLWKREGTNCMNQPEAHLILQALRALASIAAPGVLLKAEAIVPMRELPAYFGQPAQPECHIAYHSSLMAAAWGALAEQDAALVRSVVAGTPPLPPNASWLSYVRCHDDIGWNVLRAEASEAGDPQARLAAISRFFAGANGSFARGEAFQSSDPHAAHGSNGMAASLAGLEVASDVEAETLALRRLLLLHGLVLGFGALPVLYMGDELGQANDYSFRQRPDRAMDSRWLQRPLLDEQRFSERHDSSTQAGRVYAALRALVAARQRIPALAAGEPRALLPSAPPVLALQRGPGFLALYNFSGKPQPFTLQGHWSDTIERRTLSGEITLAPWAMQWLLRDN
ncbi:MULTISPECIES: alpha-amylase family glycosyl hydrolase [unclassified Duganella]|uniref:alpha-amylase family glycosyl hydrolase n=1 Tax=unclassified Duganella TaxID=2636909 RepID=UPI0006FF37D1|nr:MULTISPECIES: alpha-amylase family glycosyl hydrolase [unclassified Duganella]KQV47757.1 amylosucrase [Duganella sp. Root336D2]KRB81957.1 amylosucrase [Duganella sp. Root198D2]